MLAKARRYKEPREFSGKAVIEVENLCKSFGEVKAVDNISFTVKRGELYSLLGPNGAGKTTTINILSCTLRPEKGIAKIMGYRVDTSPYIVKNYIGICPQENILYSYLTPLENLIFFGKMYEIPKDILKKRAYELLEALDLKNKAHKKVSTLSGGQKRRVNLLAGLIHNPEVLFLDEPTAGLDPQTRRWVWDFIEQLKKEGKTIILTTHYMEEADILSDKIGIMDKGRLIAQGTPDELKRNIGKGDIITFRMEGSPKKIEEILSAFQESDFIMSWNPSQSEDNCYHITALNGIGKLATLVERFIEGKLKIKDISIKANSLENVFLSLTGRSLRE